MEPDLLRGVVSRSIMYSVPNCYKLLFTAHAFPPPIVFGNVAQRGSNNIVAHVSFIKREKHISLFAILLGPCRCRFNPVQKRICETAQKRNDGVVCCSIHFSFTLHVLAIIT